MVQTMVQPESWTMVKLLPRALVLTLLPIEPDPHDNGTSILLLLSSGRAPTPRAHCAQAFSAHVNGASSHGSSFSNHDSAQTRTMVRKIRTMVRPKLEPWFNKNSNHGSTKTWTMVQKKLEPWFKKNLNHGSKKIWTMVQQKFEPVVQDFSWTMVHGSWFKNLNHGSWFVVHGSRNFIPLNHWFATS